MTSNLFNRCLQFGIQPRLHGQSAPGDWSADLGAPSGAWFSASGQHRLLLWRTFDVGGDAPPLGFGMLNPSKAGAEVVDPTVTRCMGFAGREGAGGIIVVNLSPWCATHPRDLLAARIRGEDVLCINANAFAIEIARSFGPLVLAWGASIPPWLDSAAGRMRSAAGPEARCLGRTKHGEPRHPLFVRADAPLISMSDWSAVARVIHGTQTKNETKPEGNP